MVDEGEASPAAAAAAAKAAAAHNIFKANRNAFQKALSKKHSTQNLDSMDDGASTPQQRKRGSGERVEAEEGTQSPPKTARGQGATTTPETGGQDYRPSNRQLMSVLQSLANQMRGDREEHRQIWEHIDHRMTTTETTTAQIADRLGNIENQSLKDLEKQ